jgi:hypothetical protein
MPSALLAPSNRDALHALNGRLIDHLVEILADIVPRSDWKDWIVNVIVLHRTVGVTETATLETSATLWRGHKYYSQEACEQQNSAVRSLDGSVPIDDSFAGLCVRTANVIWVNDIDAAQKGEGPLKDVYRGFGYVGVQAPVLPAAEYVFPIRLRAGLSDIIWGVLNCEWYRPARSFGSSPFEKWRDEVVDRVTDLLELHGRYLPVVLYEDGVEEKCSTRLSDCYQRMFERHMSKRKGTQHEAHQYS